MASNDNSKQPTAKEVTNLADALFNKVSAIGGSTGTQLDTLFSELARLQSRAASMPVSRSKAANELLANAVAKGHAIAEKWCTNPW